MAALSFPRNFPDSLVVNGMSLSLEPMIMLSPLRGGSQISVDLGPTLWRGHWESDTLTDARYGEVQAWRDTLLSMEKFYAYDKRRQYPFAYPGGVGVPASWPSTAWTCQISSVNADNKRIVLKTLPAGFVFTNGDYISFVYGSSSSVALHRIVAGATASGGGTATVEVRPHIRTGASADAVVTLYRAYCEMIILPESYKDQTTPPKLGKVSFDAIQSL